MITFEQILSARDLKTCILPLWKLRIKDGEYDELKITLYDAAINNRLNLFQKEAALYYAEWWRRNYSGGAPSTDSIISKLGLHNFYGDDFYREARNGAKRLGIRFIKKNDRNYYFRTLLIQGGLPINYIRNNQNEFSGYKRFLLSLIREVKSIDVNWNNIDYIETLPCINYLPTSFKNEGIYELSLQIAHAIIEGRDDLLPYGAEDGEWQTLTNDLKKENSKEKRRVPFIINWGLFKKESLNLYYTFDCTKKIESLVVSKTSLSGCYSFSVYVQDKYVASYRRINENAEGEYYYKRMEHRSEQFQWRGESVVNIQIKGDNGSIEDITAPRSYSPDFNTPQVFQKYEDKWLLKSNRKETTENAIIFTSDWVCCDDSIPVEITSIDCIDGLTCNWIEFKDTIKLINIISSEEVEFDNSTSSYFHEFLNWTVDWIQDANYKILVRNPKILVYNSDHEIVSEKDVAVYCRIYNKPDWNLYKGFGLPTGLLEFKIILPDGKVETEKFYFLENLFCESQNMMSDSGELLWKLPSGEIYNLKEDSCLIQKIQNNLFYVKKEKDIKKIPETLTFQIQNVGMPALQLKIAIPFKGVTLLSSTGLELLDGEVVAIDSLSRLKIIVVGYNEVKADIFYQKSNTNQSESVIIREKIKKGIHSLSLYDEQIQKMFQLYGYNSFDRTSCVKMYFGEGNVRKHIVIRRFDLDSYINESGEIFINTNQSHKSEINPFTNLCIDSDGNLSLISDKDSNTIDYPNELWLLPIDVPSNEIELSMMERHSGCFTLPEICENKRMIIFSDSFAENKIVPKYYDFSMSVDSSPEQRQEFTINNIERQKKLLKQDNIFDGDSWKSIISYFKIIIKNQLPFRTLNCFTAIAQSPNLMVRFLFSLCQNLDKEEWVLGIIKFELEFAVAYHWITSQIWNEEFGLLIDCIPVVLREEILNVCAESQKYVLDFTLNADASELVNYALQENTCRNAPLLLRPDIQEMRSKIMGRAGDNTDLPSCMISNDERYFNLEGANAYQITCLLSPAKAAETLMSRNKDLWNNDNVIMNIRRTINFYRSYHSEVYYQILLNVVKRINFQNNML